MKHHVPAGAGDVTINPKFLIYSPPGIDDAKDAVKLPQLIDLSDYSAPAMPTEHIFRATWARLKRRMAGHEAPLLQHSGLDSAHSALLTSPDDAPDWSPLLQAFDEQYSAWAQDAGAEPRLRALVTPPCDTAGLLAVWAQTRGHALLREPNRIDLASLASNGTTLDLTGDGLLVIPRLENWFLRERNGLHAVRSLLSQLANADRRCLVGCDSWAWRFLAKAAGADLALPRPQTFEPFNARQLRDWFTEMARDSDGVTTTFRLAGNGYDVLACDNDGEPHNAHLRQLAASSGGIPWVAWHLWRESQRVTAGEKPLTDRAAEATAGDARTVWIVDVDDIELQHANEDRSLLVLQALLIHGGLLPAEVDAVLPTTGEPDLLTALVNSGHLQHERDTGHHRVTPTAYPSIRQALKAAGIPIGAV